MINYTSQASHTDTHGSQINCTSTTKVSGANIEPGASVGKEINDLINDKDNSENHMYAVLEEAVPPVPERYLTIIAHFLPTNVSTYIGHNRGYIVVMHKSKAVSCSLDFVLGIDTMDCNFIQDIQAQCTC